MMRLIKFNTISGEEAQKENITMEKQYMVKAIWTEAGEQAEVKRTFDTMKEVREYTKVYAEYLSNTTIEKGFWNHENEWQTVEVSGQFEIIEVGSTIIGCMSWESTYIKLRRIETGKGYGWVSDTSEFYTLWNLDNIGKVVTLSAFARNKQAELGTHLYKVKLQG